MTNADFDSLIAVGRFREAADLLDSVGTLSQSQRVWRARLQAELEGARIAAPAAAALLKEKLPASGRAACLEIVARASVHTGDVQEGLKLFDSALKLVDSSVIHSSRLQLRFTYAILNWLGIEPALARLPGLRKIVTQSGDPYSSIALHLICAEVDIKQDEQYSAESHLSAARSLLDTYPHLVQEAKLFQLRSVLAGKAARFQRALELAETSLAAAEDAGWRQGRAAALANIAHFSLMIGDIPKSRTCLAEAKELLPLPEPMGVVVRATELDLLVTEGDLQTAAATVHEVETEARELGERRAFASLWFACSRVRFLVRSGHTEDALQIANSSIPFADRFGDRSLRISLRLYGAEAAFRSGDLPSAERLLSEVCGGFDLGIDHLGELNRIIGVVVTASNPADALVHLEAASRMLKSVGLSGPVTESQPTDGRVNQMGANTAASSLSRSWASIPDCLEVPEACGVEILNILRTANVAKSAVLRQQVGTSPPVVIATLDRYDSESTNANTHQIVVSRSGTETWDVLIEPEASISARLTTVLIGRAISRMSKLAAARTIAPRSAVRNSDETPNVVDGLIVASENMWDVVRITERVASSNVTVLFSGESGTGKELLARTLHRNSPRHARPFIPFNCATVSRDMIDSQLFGYRRGAFTGAVDSFAGVIRAAAGGTLFLDEIGEMPLEVQPKLLRFLESGEVHPLGEVRPVTVDVRVVAATNADLEKLVSIGRFREDLFYRLHVVRLRVPPLRERREEIPLLVHHFVDVYSRESEKSGIRVADETLEYLVLFDWPGNVRQLANEIRRLVALAESGAVLMPEHLSEPITSSRRTVAASRRPVAPTEFVVRMDQPLSAAMKHLERSMVQYALANAGDRLEDAARMLGLSRKGLYLKRQRLNLNAADAEQEAETPPEPQPR